jgi:hypothetical protein
MGAAGLALGAGALSGRKASAAFSGRYPFKLGVASGDPSPDGMVLWTRLAPDPLNGGGAPNRNIAVRWEVSADEGFTRIVHSGTETATPGYGHSVHVEVEGLEPARYYWYRFEAGGDVSPVGRTKTAPAPDAAVAAMAFAFVSCQNWEEGYYPAYRALASEDLDVVVHLGDYIYEGAATTTGVRAHRGGDPMGPHGLPQPARAVQDRQEPAGRPRRPPVLRHLGRPRGRQQLRRPCRRRRDEPGSVPPAPRGGLPGLLRAPPPSGAPRSPAGRTCASTGASTTATSRASARWTPASTAPISPAATASRPVAPRPWRPARP